MSSFSSGYDPGVQVSGTDDVLSLHRNENLFVGRDWTVDTAQRLIEQAAISSYPESTSLPLREALAEFYGVARGKRVRRQRIRRSALGPAGTSTPFA